MKPELLSPAGSFAALKAAIGNGADAVYLGGRLFNARQYASNFDDTELQAALDYAHIRNVKIYLTMNILLTDQELDSALEYASHCYHMGIDAIITQDLGFSSLLHRYLPALPLHASTQMTAHSKDSVAALQRLGFQRVVLPRELSLSEIEEIKEEVPIALEAFIHGALCVCYSGQCLLSSSIGDRSGNRGTCAQPCRLQYQLLNSRQVALDKGHLLSTRDICTLDMLQEILTAGITSLKIEGRMKSPEYVGIVTAKYRKALNSILELCNSSHITDTDRKELLQIFNRGGFSKGYFYGKQPLETVYKEQPKNIGVPLGQLLSWDTVKSAVTVKLSESLVQGDGIEILSNTTPVPGGIITGIMVNGKFVQKALPGQIAVLSRVRIKNGKQLQKGMLVIKTSSKQLNESACQTEEKKIPVSMHLTFAAGQPIRLQITALSHSISWTEESETRPEPARTAGLSARRLKEQLLKLGNYPFYVENLELEMEDQLFVPVSILNHIRNDACEHLLQAIQAAYKRELISIPKRTVAAEKPAESVSVSALFYNPAYLEQVPTAVLQQIDRIILPTDSISPVSEPLLLRLRSAGIPLIGMLPAIYKGTPVPFPEHWDEIMVNNIGDISKANLHVGKPLCGNLGCNVYNSATLQQLMDLGLKRITLSHELYGNRGALPLHSGGELFIYGRFPVMISEYCPVGGYYGSAPCPGAGNPFFLKDKEGASYPILCHHDCCRPEILSANPFSLSDIQWNQLRKAGHQLFRIHIYDEPISQLEELLWKIKKSQ